MVICYRFHMMNIWENDELFGVSEGTVSVKDVDGNCFRVSTEDDRYLSGELVGVSAGYITVIDSDGVVKRVNKDCEGYKTGLYKKYSVPGRKHSLETIEKMSNNRKGTGVGSENSQYGTKWIYSEKLKSNKKVSLCELDEYIDNGWVIGRKMSLGK